ncbi:MAG: chromosomal replication initiator protein DnaA [Lachnospiraceae bacterium]|jgi:chromosomal replication initiator protein|nr:chromosomal replication initiator protein DnaA [Lachnospiraceae bacterium]MDE6918585.1 chromosomal replication initiator protein DnaA [Lachnospiraceae bacterium]MDE6989941.1 chromosomal replication initiator protein DnaA [Lachnospiraceae bacterium]MDE7000840.1 chromosomal replication initiator protein DnaA [Lachnospiraceae bacterium]
MNEIKDRWNEIKEMIRDEYDLTAISFNNWVEPLQFYKVEDDIVTILIPSAQARLLKYIQKNYYFCFKATISELMNHEYDVVFIAEEDAIAEKKDASAEQDRPKKGVNSLKYENANLNNKYKFDTFVVGSNNKFAHSAALAVAESPGEAYNPLYLYGGAGLGKTHLMHSIGHFVLEQNQDKKVLYVTSEQFTNEVIESIRSGNAAAMTKLRDKYRTVDVLLVDDVQFIIGKESTQEEFFHTFNVLHSAGKQIIISSDKPPKEMETLEERFRSRFEWGLIADIQPPDYETRMAILRKNAEMYDKEIDDEIIQYIATNIKSNIRELEGALNKVMANARLNKQELNLALAEDALKDVIYPDQRREVSPSLIIDVVAEHFNISKEDITSKKRNSEYVIPRQIIMYLCRHMTESTFQMIAAYLGKKDHTTVIHGVEKIEEKIKTDEDLRNKIETIQKKLTPS